MVWVINKCLLISKKIIFNLIIAVIYHVPTLMLNISKHDFGFAQHECAELADRSTIPNVDIGNQRQRFSFYLEIKAN